MFIFDWPVPHVALSCLLCPKHLHLRYLVRNITRNIKRSTIMLKWKCYHVSESLSVYSEAKLLHGRSNICLSGLRNSEQPGLSLHNSFPALSLITMAQINKAVPLSTLLQIPHHYRRLHRWELFTWRGAEWDSVGASRPPEPCMLLLLQRGFPRPVGAWSCSTLTGIVSDCVLSDLTEKCYCSAFL